LTEGDSAAATAGASVPLAARWVAKRARELADPVAVRLSEGSSVARTVPPRRLRARTGAPGAREFVAGGREAAASLAAALEVAERSPSAVRSVLDFGCGSGRVLPHMATLLGEASCTGCDVDAGAITWAARHLTAQSWSLSGAVPPLPFGAEQFDLVYSISVFSHLDEGLQDRWLAELRRVLAPGGIALLTVHGPHAFEQFRTGSVRTRWCPDAAFARGPLGADEFVFEPYARSVWNRAELPGVSASYGLAFHGPGYIRARWPGWLEVVDVRERGISDWQDVVVCRRTG
jgi:SAM-dependent methyltransferase